MPHFHDNQCAVERIPQSRQPSAASNSPIIAISRAVAPVICVASSTISASNRSNGRASALTGA